MLTRIRNAVTAKHTRVDMPLSRIKADIARILQDEGYIQGFKLLDDVAEPVKATAPVKTLRLFLKYGPHGEKLITGVSASAAPAAGSTSDARCAGGARGSGHGILTTSRGVMTGREAIKAGVGGEVLCNVW